MADNFTPVRNYTPAPKNFSSIDDAPSSTSARDKEVARRKSELAANKRRITARRKRSSGGSSSGTSSAFTPAPEEQLFTPVQAPTVTKVVEVSGKGRVSTSSTIPQSQRITTFKDKEGAVVGIEDPVTQQSSAISRTSESNLRLAEQQRFNAMPPPVVKKETTPAKRGFTTAGVFGAAPTTTTNRLDAQTKADIAASNKRTRQLNNPILRPFIVAGEAFKQSFTFGRDKDIPDVDSAIGLSAGVQRGGDDIPKMLGGFTGLYANAAVSATTAVAGVNVGQAVTGAVQPLFTSGSMLANTGLNLIGGTAVGLTSFELTKQTSKIKEKIVKPSRDLKLTKAEKEVFNVAREEEQNNLNFVGRIGFGMGVAGEERTFLTAAEKELNRRNVPIQQQRRILEKLEIEREATQSGVLVGTLATGAFSEFTGQTQVTDAFNKGAKKSFGTFFTAIAPAGAGEGFSQVLLSQKSVGDTRNFFTGKKERFGLDYLPIQPSKKQLEDPAFRKGYLDIREKTKFSTTPFQESLGGAAGGFVVSGVLGGGIGSAAVKGKKGKSNFLRFIGNVADPSELPSDFLASGATAVGRTRVPVVSFTPTLTTVPTNTQTKTNINNVVGVQTESPTNINNIIGTQTRVPTLQVTPTNTLTKTPTNILTDTPVPVDPITDVPVDPIVDVPVDPFVNVPVAVPINRLGKALPPIPPSFSLGGGGFARAGKGRNTKFLNELTASTTIFKGLVGINNTRKTTRKASKKTSKAKRKSTRRQPQSKRRGNSFNKINKRLFG